MDCVSTQTFERLGHVRDFQLPRLHSTYGPGLIRKCENTCYTRASIDMVIHGGPSILLSWWGGGASLKHSRASKQTYWLRSYRHSEVKDIFEAPPKRFVC